MSEKILKARIKIRTGDRSYWTEHADEILLKGELAYDSDTGLLTVGDGRLEYARLPTVETDYADQAAYAERLTTSSGDSITPVYIDEDGLAQSINYSIEADVPADAVFTDTTYENATTTVDGLMSSSDKKKLDGIAENANNYVLPLAANGARGGIQTGFAASGANIPVALSSEKAYVGLTTTAINAAITNNQITPGTIKLGGCTIAYDSVTPSLTFSFT